MRKFDFLTASPSDCLPDRKSPVASGTNEPRQIFDLQTPLVGGWYGIQAEVASDAALDPKIYFDIGQGFSESLSVRMKHLEGSKFGIVIRLPEATTAIRLDPMNRSSEYRLLDFSAQRLGGLSLARHLAGFGLAVLMADPRGFASRLPRYVEALSRPRFLRLGDPAAYLSTGGPSYESWIARHDFDERHHSEPLRQAVAAIANPPLISVLMPTYNTPAPLLREAIDSVLSQIYPHWQLCIADDASTAPMSARYLPNMRKETAASGSCCARKTATSPPRRTRPSRSPGATGSRCSTTTICCALTRSRKSRWNSSVIRMPS